MRLCDVILVVGHERYPAKVIPSYAEVEDRRELGLLAFLFASF